MYKADFISGKSLLRRGATAVFEVALAAFVFLAVAAAAPPTPPAGPQQGQEQGAQPGPKQDQSTPAENRGSEEGYENPQAIQMRQFLGLGRQPDRKAASEGAKIFGSSCAFCHGADARGGQGPDLLRSSVVLDDQEGELIGPVVHNGRAAKGMPVFASFTDEQIRDIAEFLHLQVELAANRGTYKIQNIVTGNAKAGETYFNGEGKCNTCHSPLGDLAHIGSKLRPPDLQQAFLYPGVLMRKSTPKATVTLPDGKTLTGKLKHLDDFSVSLCDADGICHSLPLEKGIKVDVDDKLLFHRQMLDKYTDAQMHDLTAYLVTLK
ncbi:MAG TPA: cytochrome c [Acidobacteriaceae bacterium]